MNNLANGIQLMLIGMVTVFIILTIVIYGSKLLITIINRLAPEEPERAKGKEASGTVPTAILEAAVAQITAGTGKIIKITEI